MGSEAVDALVKSAVVIPEHIGQAMRKPQLRTEFEERVIQVSANAILNAEVIGLASESFVSPLFWSFLLVTSTEGFTPPTKYMRTFLRLFDFILNRRGSSTMADSITFSSLPL